ncbi:MAG: helix-turn-helix domain containing protein [bacterium]|nr:helix-turn-helix domain containing protein [bacterium]
MSTKDVFLIEALRLFAQKGYEAVSVAEIAREVNVSAPALYKHYKSKQDLFDAICEMSNRGYKEQMEQMWPDYRKDTDEFERFAALDEDALVEHAKKMLEHTLHDEYPALFRKMMTVEQFHIPKLAQIYNDRYVGQQIKSHTMLFEKLMEIGYMRKGDPEVLAIEFVSPLNVFIEVCDRDPSKEEWAFDLLERHVRNFYRTNNIKE